MGLGLGWNDDVEESQDIGEGRETERMVVRRLEIQRQVEGLVCSKDISSPIEGKTWRMTTTPVYGSWGDDTAVALHFLVNYNNSEGDLRIQKTFKKLTRGW